MIWRRDPEARLRRLEHAACVWVERMLRDPKRYGAGLRRWVGHNSERAELYNHAYREAKAAAAAGAAIYGSRVMRAGKLGPHKANGIPLGWVAAVTAGLVLIGIAMSLAMAYLSSGHSDMGAENFNQSYATQTGEVRDFALPDGSHVLLDTESEAEVRYSANLRTIQFTKGRARFTVAHAAHRPFMVAMPQGTVTARGTVFDVTAYGNGIVHLLSGAVDVAVPNGGPSPSMVRLRSGQELRLGKAIKSPSPINAPANEGQWATGIVTFDDVPAATVVAEANRYAKRKIVINDPLASSRHVFLDIHIRRTEDVARNLAAYLQLELDASRADVLLLKVPHQAPH